jgi:RNA polymerase sigma-70 factor (ECF subfamily)
MDAAELQNLINKLIAILTPRQQEIFKMSRSMHLSNREIAERLSISEKTVENHINGALKFLRKNIQLYLLFLYF